MHTDRDHVWHMDTLRELCSQDPAVLRATNYRVVDLADPESEAEATAWWQALVSGGGEGMVVKPLEWIRKGSRGVVQPAVKCRGPEYLRIIYGPEYRSADQLERLRNRGLSIKRKLARKELALGLEALHRFVENEPLHRVARVRLWGAGARERSGRSEALDLNRTVAGPSRLAPGHP